MTDNLWILFAAAGVMVAVIVTLSLLGDHYTLNNIKSKTVGDGQHGTARWATDAELRKTYASFPSKCRTGVWARTCLMCRVCCWAASVASTASLHW